MKAKISVVLRIIALFFCIILLRTGVLSLLQRETKEKEAAIPRHRTVVQQADRGIIYDRFHIPIALNQITYHAAIYYSEITEIPAIEWKKEASGHKEKRYPRRQYVHTLADMLGRELHMDPERIEDLIYAKASLFPHTPYILKEPLSEEEYYRLKMREKDWPGLHAGIGTERTYPFHKTASHLIGTMGLISQPQYLELATTIRTLEAALLEGEGGTLPEGFTSYQDILSTLLELKERAYTVHDLVGKSGIEASQELTLRGRCGKTVYEVDTQGHLLHPLPNSCSATSGEDLTLAISIELQEFAEALLTQDELIREGRSVGAESGEQKKKIQKQPWIKGGAIVALDPRNGEILALASTPRFDPNDFLHQGPQLHRWLEHRTAIQAIWDGEAALCRETYHNGRWQEATKPLSWPTYLEALFPSDSALALFFQRVAHVKEAIQIQEDYEALLYFSPVKDPALLFTSTARTEESALYQKRLENALSCIPSVQDRLFAIDLCRVVIHAPAFTDRLIERIGSLSLERYRLAEQQFHRFEMAVQATERERFHQHEFAAWKQEHQKSFLQALRAKELEDKRSPRPYIDSLDQKERELFMTFWKEQRLERLITAFDLASHVDEELGTLCRALPKEFWSDLFTTFRSFQHLERPLVGHYARLHHAQEMQLEKDLASAFYPIEGFGFSRSYAFQTSAPPGSPFKLVTAYAAMQATQSANPLTLIDEQAVGTTPSCPIVAFSADRVPYPRFYKGGRLPKSAHPALGELNLVSAIAQSSNPYFALLAGDVLRDPEALVHAASLFGFGQKSGCGLPGETAGQLPTDLSFHRTGLYSAAIGQHTLLATPLQTALLFATIGMNGKRPVPLLFAHKEPHHVPIDFPPFIQRTLLEGMHQVVWGERGGARPRSIRKLRENPLRMAQFLALQGQMIGKSGTAEILYNPYVYPSSRAQMYKHIWFGALAFPPEGGATPELIVVVYLRYGDSGKEAAPLAAEIIHKWRAIRAAHSNRSK